MENIKRLVLDGNLISSGETIGVGVSGGKDSMALLCYLKNLSKELNFEVVAITVDHGIRKNGKADAEFVVQFCNKNNIRVYKFKIDSVSIAKQKCISLESAAREGRYSVFETMLKKQIVDKIAIAHHRLDQAETILMHLFRGSGISGLKGMQAQREKYIRPMLDTKKEEIEKFINDNNIPFVQDETNFENEFNRNYIRNEILPLIQKRWPNAVNSILNFANLASVDDDFITSMVPSEEIVVEGNIAKIPLNLFVYKQSISSRLVYSALRKIGINKDIENKHIDMILNFVKNSSNGKKLELPLKVCVYREYDFLTIVNKQSSVQEFCEKFKLGTIEINKDSKLEIKKVNSKQEGLCFDADKIPKNCVWRYRRNGDLFNKFGSGTKKLKDYFIDAKIPQRLRNSIPVLANKNEILIVAGYEISEKIKITSNSTNIYSVILKK